ncbi:MAG: sporulation protein [Actinomyces sp.]|nr:MAG: sporulation protein [Actinomyces sp.]
MRAVRAALAAVCAAALAGCSSFPMSSAPEPFDVSSRDNGVVQFAADGPSDGADPVSLVKDFLRACAAGTNDDYATARLFLTESSASNWKPEEEVLVHESDTENTPTIAPRDGDDDSDSAVTVTVSFTAIASVDSVGILTHSPHTTIDQEYSLVRKGGQWRIESPADVVVMSRSAFTASYQLANLYFPAATQDALVADPRWLPSRRLAGHLLDGLAKGPRPSLAAAVVNAIAAGGPTPSRGVETTERAARVDLSGPEPASEQAAGLLVWEIRETLTQVPDISTVEVTISGQPLSAAAPPMGPSYSLDTLVGLSEAGMVYVSGATVSSVPVSETPSPTASRPTASPVSASLVAWNDGDATRIARVGSAVATTAGSLALGPSIDRFGWVWTGGSDEDGPIAVVNEEGPPSAVAIESDPDGDVRGVRLSADGARALVVRGRTSLWTATVERESGGKPLRLSHFDEVPTGGAGLVDASWAGAGTIMYVTEPDGPQGEPQLVTLPLGGLPTSTPLSARATAMSAGGSPSAVVLVAQEAQGQSGAAPQALTRSGALWQPLPAGVREARYAG